MGVRRYLRPVKRRAAALRDRVRLRRAFTFASRRYPGLDTTIAKDDVMFSGDPHFYFAVGASAMAAIQRGLDAANHGEPLAVLDFACGHGRVMRFLRASWPEAAITASDVDRDGTDFCASRFAATPVYSRDPLNGLDVGGPFDLIWSGSLLTHFDAPRWAEALSFFRRHLTANGVLVFSTHGERSAEILGGDDQRAHELILAARYGLEPTPAERMAEEYRVAGFSFAPWPNETFGLSVASEAWITDMLQAARLRVIQFEEGAWLDHQDVVTAVLDD